jgi:hypothetical protein
MEVPRVHTKPTADEWRAAMLDAARSLGVELDDTALSVLWAQWALETGRGGSCFNNNLGNIKYSGDGDWMWLDTFEYINGARVNMPDKFRAFLTLAAGAFDYLHFLCRPAYSLPWAHVLAGDADGFARALRVKGYYTAPVEDYAKGLRSLAAEYQRTVSHTRDTLPSPAPDDTSITVPDAPSPIRRASSQSMVAVNAPIIEGGATIDADDGTAVTPLRAEPGEKEYKP